MFLFRSKRKSKRTATDVYLDLEIKNIQRYPTSLQGTRLKMGNINSSVGVEIEFLIATREGGDKPLDKPRQFRTAKGGPIVIERGGVLATEVVPHRVRAVIEAAVRGHEGDRVIDSDIDIEEDVEAWHLRNYRHWDAKRDVSVVPPANFYDDDPNLRNFGWIDVEVTSPALFATEKSWAEIHHVVTALNEAFWIIAPSTAALHTHYGRGKNWIPLNHLRRIGAFLFAGDPTITQMHPEHMRNEERFWCPSNRMLSNLAHGVPRQEASNYINTHYSEVQSEEVPELDDSSQELEPRPTLERGPKFTSIFPRGSLPGYWFLQKEFDNNYPDWMEGREPLPTSVRGKPLDIVSAARELLATENGPTVALLMRYRLPNRMAYNFRAYAYDEYRRPRLEGRLVSAYQPKRTLEFRQAAGTVDPDEVVAHAKVVVRLCEWASAAPIGELWKRILDLAQAEKHSDWYDVFDLLVDLDLVDEARIIQRQMANARGIKIADEETGSVESTPAVTNPPNVQPKTATALSRLLSWRPFRRPRRSEQQEERRYRIQPDGGIPDINMFYFGY